MKIVDRIEYIVIHIVTFIVNTSEIRSSSGITKQTLSSAYKGDRLRSCTAAHTGWFIVQLR